MKKLIIFSLIIAVLLPGSVALASDISGALYRMGITITNTGTAATGVATVATINTPNLIAGKFCSDSVTNMAMQNSAGGDVPFMPGYEANPWVFFVPTIGNNAQINNTLYTADSSEGNLVYFPGTGGMTATDSATLEPGNNFEYEWFGYSDMTTVANWISKSGGISWGVSAAGTIKAAIAGAGTATNANMTINGAGDSATLPYSSGANHWEQVDDPVASPDNDSTKVGVNGSGSGTDYYALTGEGSIPSDAIINYVQVVMRDLGTVGYGSHFARLRLNSNYTEGTSRCPSSWTTYTETLSRPGGGSWSYSDLANLQVGCYVVGSSGSNYVTQLYVVVNYTPALEITSTGNTAGEHEYRLTHNGSTVKLYVDDVEKASGACTASVPDTSSGWTLMANVTYMEYYKFTKSGTLRQNIAWEYHRINGSTLTNGTGVATGSPVTLLYGNNTITVTTLGTFTVHLSTGIYGTATSGSTTVSGSPQSLVEGDNTVTTTTSTGTFTINLFQKFHDLSGNGNHVTPTYRTTSSDADITAAAVSFQPVNEAKAPLESLGDSPAWLTSAPSISGNFSTTNTTATFPGAAVIKALADASATPAELPLNIITGWVILALSFSMSAVLRKNMSMTLFVKGFLIALLMGIAVAVKVFDFWMIILFVYFGVTVALISADPRWG
jgi:hypothetical protein